LPDGLFSNPKSQFGQILKVLAMENLGIFYGHLVYFVAIHNFVVYFTPFWYFGPKKSGNAADYCHVLLAAFSIQFLRRRL
jgi:hypothetical protein